MSRTVYEAIGVGDVMTEPAMAALLKREGEFQALEQEVEKLRKEANQWEQVCDHNISCGGPCNSNLYRKKR